MLLNLAPTYFKSNLLDVERQERKSKLKNVFGYPLSFEDPFVIVREELRKSFKDFGLIFKSRLNKFTCDPTGHCLNKNVFRFFVSILSVNVVYCTEEILLKKNF